MGYDNERLEDEVAINLVVKYGPWEKHYFCKHCSLRVAIDDIIEQVCPHCGASVKIGNLPTFHIVRRKAYTYIPTFFERIFQFKKPEWYWEKNNE